MFTATGIALYCTATGIARYYMRGSPEKELSAGGLTQFEPLQRYSLQWQGISQRSPSNTLPSSTTTFAAVQQRLGQCHFDIGEVEPFDASADLASPDQRAGSRNLSISRQTKETLYITLPVYEI